MVQNRGFHHLLRFLSCLYQIILQAYVCYGHLDKLAQETDFMTSITRNNQARPLRKKTAGRETIDPIKRVIVEVLQAKPLV